MELEDVLEILRNYSITLSHLVLSLLTDSAYSREKATQDLLANSDVICLAFLRHLRSSESEEIMQWAMQSVQRRLCSEVGLLTQSLRTSEASVADASMKTTSGPSIQRMRPISLYSPRKLA